MDEEDDVFTQAAGTRLHKKKIRKNPLSEKELEDLLREATDASEVLLRIEGQDEVLDKLLKEVSNIRKLELKVKVLAKGVNDPVNAQPQAVMNVLIKFIDSEDFHEQIKYSFNERCAQDAVYIKAVLSLFKCTAQAFQQRAPKVLAHIFLGLETCIELYFQNDDVINEEKNVVKRMLQPPKKPRNDDEMERRRAQVNNDADVDPNLFRELSIIPTAHDFDPARDIEYRANKIQGDYENINDYLDIQFRLLRADLILPLRKNILQYLEGGDQKEYRGMQVYTQVRIVRPKCNDKGLCFRLSFDVSHHRRVNWSVSQRLKYGSLLCLSADNFLTYQCAVVENREPKDLARGLVDVQFILNVNGPDIQLGGHDEFMRLISETRDQRYIMVESPTYFEAYKYVLLGLQHFTENNFPFWRYIGLCNNNTDLPEYLQNRQNPIYDLRPLVDNDYCINDIQDDNAQFSQASEVAASVNILDCKVWPSPNTFSLDNSQFVALQTALTKEFSIIQGPPGTGKTFIGLMVMKALLHNKQIWLGDRAQSPILLVCYTNHALDQFLEGILNFFRGSLIRVGSRSKSERLEEFNLRGMRNRARVNRNVPIDVHLARQETRLKMKDLKAAIHVEAAKLEILEREIVKESFLKCVINKVHYNSLTQHSEHNNSIILQWLGISSEVNNLEGKKDRQKKIAKQNQVQNTIRHEEGARVAADENGDVSEEEEDDDDVHLLEMITPDQPQNRYQDIDNDDVEEDNELFRELFEGLGENFIENMRNVNKRLNDADEEANAIKQQNVAFDITEYGEESMPKGLSKDQKEHWKSLVPIKKRYRAILLNHLQTVDKMSEDEVQQIYNVWRMKRSDKWRLYRYWVDIYCRQIRGEIRDKSEQYEQTARRYQEILHQEDKRILEKATIIGMTTTGAARYQGILHEIGPKIVIVEEAAEVLEGHVITSLTDQCQHVVLIGDHKQLRPNPSVHELKKDCALDISLFERLLNNGFHYDCLRYQHRMRPEISKLLHVPELYPDLQDHEVVKRYPDVQRVKGNVCFIQHYEFDSQEHDTCTFSNEFEARFIIGLCEYILLQGQFRAEQITILSPYAGQIHLIKNLIEPLAKSHKTVDNFKGVKISSVDNYQGNENDIILLSLVRSNEADEIGFLKTNNRICVALSRAKIGLYVIGNFESLERSSPLMQDIISEAKKMGFVKDHIVLSCLRHPKKETIIKDPKDFAKVSEGGCAQPCEMRLNCGHSCKRICHADDAKHENAVCNEICKQICEKCKQHCNENHSCGQHDFCHALVDKRIPICRHIQKVPCHMEPIKFECKKQCDETLPCGHQCTSRCGSHHNHTQDMCNMKIKITSELCGHGHFQVVCGQSRNLDKKKCPEPCNTELECGHFCAGTCGQCANKRLHVDCQQKCKKILICGHECRSNCSSCPPCTQPCETACSHSRCPKRCGELCMPCVQSCSWNCRHNSCAELCCQPCARPPCDVQCPKRLPCGHICSGLCGEKCPRLCSICDKKILINESLYGYDGDPTTQFVEVDCGHVIEIDFMDQWMKTSTGANEEIDVQEIGLKTCPVCKSPVRKCARYNTQIKNMLCLIESVKRKYIGEKCKEMKARLDKVISELRGVERQIIDQFIQQGSQVLSEVILEAQMNQVNLIRMISALRIATEECLRRFDTRPEIFKSILSDLERFSEWALKKRACFSEQNKMDAETERNRLSVLLDLSKIEGTVTQRGLREKLHNRHMILLGQKIKELSVYKRGETDEIDDGKELCEELRKMIPDSNISLSADEKMAIVRAVNVSKGAWYQCRNGHIYAIGECGRAMEESKCPECNARIGGTNHELLSDNAWSSEMDNAEVPVYDNIDADRELAMRLQEQLEFVNPFDWD